MTSHGPGAGRSSAPWVAGHLCLDLKPGLPRPPDLSPGALSEVGPLATALGGAVGNVGLALDRLAHRPHLLARCGDDALADLLRTVLARDAGAATPHLIDAADGTSYTVVLNPPDADRTFLHHAGCNHGFVADDLFEGVPEGVPLLHLGYPPLMRGLYHDEGRALATALESLRAHGTAVSLDMALPDPSGPSGRVDWRAFLRRVLPHVDLYLPSWAESWLMLHPGEGVPAPTRARAATLTADLLAFGPAVVGLKVGADGIYLRAGDAAPAPLLAAASWREAETHAPSFAVEVTDTTGAGDATVAGLLSALLEGASVPEAAAFACAVGAAAVEAPDGIAGLPPADELHARVAKGWATLDSALAR